MQTITVRKAGRAFNGFERDSGKIVHLIPKPTDDVNGGNWDRSLCGAKPGLRGNGWKTTILPVTCEKCIKKSLSNPAKTKKMKSNKCVKIPCDPESVEKLKKWAAHYGMKVRHRRGDGDYYEVSYKDPLDLYWLGCNMVGNIVQTLGLNPNLYEHAPPGVRYHKPVNQRETGTTCVNCGRPASEHKFSDFKCPQ